jgi:site-specific recombinase XerD
MKTHAIVKLTEDRPSGWPTADELAALRAWYAGLPARDAVSRYLGNVKTSGQSSRSMVGAIRRQLAKLARTRHRDDLATLFAHPANERSQHARAVAHAIDTLRHLPTPQPLITDDVERWFPSRTVNALHRHGIKTLAALTVRVPRRRRWWSDIEGLGAHGAAQIEAFFADHSDLTERARALVVTQRTEAKPWEHLAVPAEVDGSKGTFRAPRGSCPLTANNDYDAIQAWLALQDSTATQRAYRKEAERLILWAILEKGRALSSLTTEDATAYRQFLRNPAPRDRWVGPGRPRSSSEWKPFQGPLSARSQAYALSVISGLYRWLIEQRYLLANPFAGVKVKGAKRTTALDATRGFSEHEWVLIRTIADGVEWGHGWSEAAAKRLRFSLDFWYVTGLRPHEMVAAKLGHIRRDDHDDDWLKVTGKGSKEGEVALPLFAMSTLDRYLAYRRLPVTRARWDPATLLLPSLEEDGKGITTARLWALMRRFFAYAAQQFEASSPATAEKLRRATPHWLRHTHATHALARGAELTTVRDNLRHASVSTTSVYLHTDQAKRARQMRDAFPITN